MFTAGTVAQREHGKVTFYLSKGYPTPPVPFELHGLISPDDWAVRFPVLTKLAARYYKPVFERVWLILAVLIPVLLPLALYRLIFISLYPHDGTDTSKYFFVRFIGVFIFLAALLLFWSPIIIWKRIGRHRVDALLASYAAADAMRPFQPDFTPKWAVTIPGVFSTHTILTITTPPNAPITSFHPDAYLPAYIGKAEEAQGAYFYPYPATSQKAGIPRMSVVGGYGAVQEKV